MARKLKPMESRGGSTICLLLSFPQRLLLPNFPALMASSASSTARFLICCRNCPNILPVPVAHSSSPTSADIMTQLMGILMCCVGLEKKSVWERERSLLGHASNIAIILCVYSYFLDVSTKNRSFAAAAAVAICIVAQYLRRMGRRQQMPVSFITRIRSEKCSV